MENKMKDKLVTLRLEIDEVNTEILAALARRAEIVQKVFSEKQNQVLRQGQQPAIYDPAREEAIVNNIVKNNNSALSNAAMARIFRAIIAECRNLQLEQAATNTGKTVAIQGVASSYNEQAYQQYCLAQGLPEMTKLYSVTSDQVLQDLKADRADFGVVAIYNNQAGFVKESLAALQSSHCNIAGSITLPIQHCFLTNSEEKPQTIKAIYSHPQALKQCAKYLSLNYPNAELIEYIDTAKAAEDLSEGKLDSDASAVIASRGCANTYNLSIQDINIQDNKDNATTFLILKKSGR